MSTNTIIENASLDEVLAKFRGVVREEIQSFKPAPEDSYKTRAEAARKLRVSLVTLDKAVDVGILTGFRLNGRVLFKDSDLENALTKIPVKRRLGR
jgi:hypothetical protein